MEKLSVLVEEGEEAFEVCKCCVEGWGAMEILRTQKQFPIGRLRMASNCLEDPRDRLAMNAEFCLSYVECLEEGGMLLQEEGGMLLQEEGGMLLQHSSCGYIHHHLEVAAVFSVRKISTKKEK